MNHIYREYKTLGVTICLNCMKYRHDIEAQLSEIAVFEKRVRQKLAARRQRQAQR